MVSNSQANKICSLSCRPCSAQSLTPLRCCRSDAQPWGSSSMEGTRGNSLTGQCYRHTQSLALVSSWQTCLNSHVLQSQELGELGQDSTVNPCPDPALSQTPFSAEMKSEPSLDNSANGCSTDFLSLPSPVAAGTFPAEGFALLCSACLECG